MTAQADTKNLQGCLSVGMDGYLAKPLRAESLIRGVEDLVLRTGLAPSARGRRHPIPRAFAQS